MAFHYPSFRLGLTVGPARHDSVIPGQGLANNDAFFCNVKQPNVLAVLAATDFNHREDAFELALRFRYSAAR